MVRLSSRIDGLRLRFPFNGNSPRRRRRSMRQSAPEARAVRPETIVAGEVVARARRPKRAAPPQETCRRMSALVLPAQEPSPRCHRRRRVPYWNPFISGGQPLAANPTHEVFYPLTWRAFSGSTGTCSRCHSAVSHPFRTVDAGWVELELSLISGFTPAVCVFSSRPFSSAGPCGPAAFADF